ncbi:spore germination protein GerD [Alkalihalobacillus alcalophilus ATCC 27647 = CGMCC 1.3604]|uniref:Spore germination protein GerD n=1 Tax=Alkalihalobacillus alcalophilus ATCC 27647 = CGMCC 1.3604 TaxID=1218173 RepID=A0A094XHN7_ALKAL|nr:spore germination lipoprotein GerD [Alkalihalobacillus alcalophilus]KGA98270.1 spore gernimation protein GerD [Alkalihalobacillus alcalophilus ATCC 27647 = CGMCC 1.3604]MED1561587.1 spore germination lipoprotein GerD [Alkalihalobacillus alcalophilus]THG89870.1 spore germination protein GerD [Alkalihalobacillus alcalophilus ATCC 27647 = CGMCC 1.3604]
MKALQKLLVLCLLATLLSACAAAQENGSNADYDNMKKMMVDMLKTDEGKQAIHEIMTEEEVRHDLVMDNLFVKQTVQQTLTSEQGKKYWQELMQEPEFAKTFAETMQSENEKILKRLMKDPEYQAMMIAIFTDKEVEDSILELLKSKEYREQQMTVMAEAFESPYFIAKVNNILSKVTEEQLEKQDESGGDSGSGENGEESGG